MALSDRDGTIGSGFLRRFNLIFDYRRRNLYFKKNSGFKQPSRYNIAGVEIVQSFNYIPQTEVTHGFDTHRQRGNIEQQHIFYIAAQYTALDSCTNSHYFIGVYPFRRSFAEEFLNSSLYSRDTGRTTYKDHFIDIVDG